MANENEAGINEENVEAVNKPAARKPAATRKTSSARSTTAKASTAGSAPKRRGRPPVQKPVVVPESVNPVDSEPVDENTVVVPAAEPVELAESTVVVDSAPVQEPAAEEPQEPSTESIERIEEKLEQEKDAIALEEADKSNIPHGLSEAALKNRKYILAGLAAIAVVSLIAIGVVIGLTSAQFLAQEAGNESSTGKMMVDEDSPYNESYILDVWKEAYKEGIQDGYQLSIDGYYSVSPYQEDYYDIPLEEEKVEPSEPAER